MDVLNHLGEVCTIIRAPLFNRNYIAECKDKNEDIRLDLRDIKEIIDWPDYKESQVIINKKDLKLDLDNKLDFLYLQISLKQNGGAQLALDALSFLPLIDSEKTLNKIYNDSSIDHKIRIKALIILFGKQNDKNTNNDFMHP